MGTIVGDLEALEPGGIQRVDEGVDRAVACARDIDGVTVDADGCLADHLARFAGGVVIEVEVD